MPIRQIKVRLIILFLRFVLRRRTPAILFGNGIRMQKPFSLPRSCTKVLRAGKKTVSKCKEQFRKSQKAIPNCSLIKL